MSDTSGSHLTQRHHGYYSDRSYIYGVHGEYFPLRLALLATLHGHRSLALEERFRVLDIGCGQGLGLCIQAALHPQAHFCGIDLLPAHINHGRSLAAAASLSNVSFVEADLIKLADQVSPRATTPWRDPSAPPGSPQSTPACAPFLADVDLAVCHGLVSWVSPEVEEAVWRLASSSLRTGGLFCLSYNALPGKLHEVPFQHLVSTLQRTNGSGSASFAAALAQCENLQRSGSSLFAAQPSLAPFLAQLPSQDPAYLPHEYNQKHWLPRFVDTVIRKAEDQGLSYLGAVSLPDRFEGLLPQSFREILAVESDVAQRQLLRDLLTNESFRRDVYVRGLDALWPRETAQAIADLQILRLLDERQLEESDPGELFTFTLGFGTIQGDRRWFGSFLAALGTGSHRMGDLLDIPGVGAVPPGGAAAEHLSPAGQTAGGARRPTGGGRCGDAAQSGADAQGAQRSSLSLRCRPVDRRRPGDQRPGLSGSRRSSERPQRSRPHRCGR